jgi:plasmid stabilization system protein ParE
MPRVRLSALAKFDLSRLYNFLHPKNTAVAIKAAKVIEADLLSLSKNPKMGRPALNGTRELIIRFGKSGYIALYSFNETANEVLILAIRHQLEKDYSGIIDTT